MAAAAASEHILEEIGEAFLRCSICLEQYKSPKILPCLHTFCEKCLVTLVEKTGSLHCPECRQKYRLPVDGVPALKTNFFMNNLIGTIKQRLEATQGVEIKCDGCQDNTATHRCLECKHHLCNSCVKAHRNIPVTKAHTLMTNEEYQNSATKSKHSRKIPDVEYCNDHQDDLLKYYCDTCKVPVCTSCTIINHRIPEHVHGDLKVAADKYLTKLNVMVDKLKVKEEETEQKKNLARQIHSDLKGQYNKEKIKVRVKAEELIEKIQKEQQRLQHELKKSYKIKIKRAAVDIDELELKHGNIKSALSYIEALMHHGNAAQLLSAESDVVYRINQLISMGATLRYKHDEVVFTPWTPFCENGTLGALRSDVCMSNCTVENIPEQLMNGDSADLLIVSRDSAGNEVIPKQRVKAKVRIPDASWEDVTVEEDKDGTHKVKVTAQVDDKVEVIVTIADQTMPGCPFIIPVVTGLMTTIGSKGTIKGQYSRPHSVAVNKERAIVAADRDNNRLQVTTKEGKFMKIIKFEQFEKAFMPCDVALSSDNTCYSLDDNNKQVVVSDEDGEVIKCFGQSELKDPYGIGISPINGNVYVTDRGGHCVRVFEQNGKYLKSFGSEGEGRGKFNQPWGVVIGSNGIVYVADRNNQRIQVFNAHDRYLYAFRCVSTDGQMRNPRGLAIESDKYVYVTAGYPHCLLKFESGGKLVCRIDTDTDGLHWPIGVALTDDVPCRLVVADMGRHCIKVFVQ
ncbi:tripartite motif-containing protein 2-like [Ptychodera flava]|uniref:tripartite motif-containing protein 2-like n=1 Tax=Ptychodera flava TaxID=63121 RepID=UPI003969EFA7